MNGTVSSFLIETLSQNCKTVQVKVVEIGLIRTFLSPRVFAHMRRLRYQKDFIFFRRLWKFLKKGPKMSICTQTAHPKFSHNWKFSKISRKMPIFACYARCALWVPIPFWGDFWDFFWKTTDLKKILWKNYFFDFGPFLPCFKAKNAKNSNFSLFFA